MPKPKPSPKRTNWKQAYERISAKIQHAEENRDYYLKRWTLAEEKLKKTEAHNAELLKEREELRRDNGDLFLRLERFRTGLDKPEKEYCLCGETAPNCKCEQKFGKPQSWLQRVWRKWRA